MNLFDQAPGRRVIGTARLDAADPIGFDPSGEKQRLLGDHPGRLVGLDAENGLGDVPDSRGAIEGPVLLLIDRKTGPFFVLFRSAPEGCPAPPELSPRGGVEVVHQRSYPGIARNFSK